MVILCNVRILLAVYMITAFPGQVFEKMGELETTLFKSSIKFLETFKAITEAMLNSETKSFYEVPESLTKEYTSKIRTYHRDFKRWKVIDDQYIKFRIKHALEALYEARAHLPEDEPADSKLSLEFDQQIKRLREKLGQPEDPAAAAARGN